MPTRVDPADRLAHPANSPRPRRFNANPHFDPTPQSRRAMPDRDTHQVPSPTAVDGWDEAADWENVVDLDAARRRHLVEEAEEDADLAPQRSRRRQVARGRGAFARGTAGAARRPTAAQREEAVAAAAPAEKSEAAPPCHWGLYVIAILLTLMSIPLVYSASMAIALDHHGRADFFLFRQIGYVVAGAVVLVLSSLTSARHLRLVVWALYLTALLGLLATDLTPLGLVLGGVRRWMRIGPVQLQFSELAKIALVGVMADFWSRAARFAPKSVAPWAMTALLALPVIGLVFVQPHFSAASLLFALPICIAFYAGVPWQRMMRVGLCLVLVGGAVVPLLKPYQRERVMAHLSFLKHDSNQDEQGANYQALQGQRALAAGGLFGAGLGGGIYKQGHLPAPHTDFIASSIGEEWGLAGMMFLLSLYGLMIFFCFHTGHCASSSFEALLCAGVGTLLGLQVVGNIGVVTGVLPVTGMPLPLLSYGGSGMICTLLGIGLVLSVSRRYGACHSPTSPVAS